jgi:predicted TIM-barrel fold metal-dependent hydrolase
VWDGITDGNGRVIFDSHLHILDPRFPLVPNQGYLPDPFTVDDYRARTANLGVVGGAVVSGSFQAFDRSYLVDALERLGPGFVGVVQLPATVTDEEVVRLAGAGVRALRFNQSRGGSEDLRHLEALARRVDELAAPHALSTRTGSPRRWPAMHSTAPQKNVW